MIYVCYMFKILRNIQQFVGKLEYFSLNEFKKNWEELGKLFDEK